MFARIERAETTERTAELILPKRRYRLVTRLEVVGCVELVVADELEQAALKRVRTRPRGDIDQGRRLAAELRRILRLLDLEFLD